MSSTSVARQNRRIRQQQMSAMNSLSSSPLTLTANTLTSAAANLNSYEESTDCSLPVDENKANEPSPDPAPTTGCSFVNCDVSSQPVGKVFIEDERGFRVVDAQQVQLLKNEYSSVDSMDMEPAIVLSYKAASLFHKFSQFCHGLLGGMSLVHLLLLIHLITSNTSPEDTVKHFGFLSQPVHNIYNFIVMICCISAFDRYDVGSFKNLFKSAQKCHVSICIVIIYPLCLLLSLSTANVDEKFWLPYTNTSNYDLLLSNGASNEIFYWKTLSLLKCAGAIIAWILISFNPNHNVFLNQLKNILEKNKIMH